MIRRPPRSTQGVSSAASDVYKRQFHDSPKIPHLLFGSCSNTVYLYSIFTVVVVSSARHLSAGMIRRSNMKWECIMNYLLEDIFRRADTWRGMDQHGMDPSGLGQQQRVFLHPENTAANGDAHTFSPVSERVSMYWIHNCITEAGLSAAVSRSSATSVVWMPWGCSCP